MYLYVYRYIYIYLKCVYTESSDAAGNLCVPTQRIQTCVSIYIYI